MIEPDCFCDVPWIYIMYGLSFVMQVHFVAGHEHSNIHKWNDVFMGVVSFVADICEHVMSCADSIFKEVHYTIYVI